MGSKPEEQVSFCFNSDSSSPLGMLFDHGSDAITGFLIGGQTIKMFKVMGTSGILAIYMFVMSIFFTAMWMQYSIGFFRLGRINPVDEGLPAYALLAFVMAFIDRTNFENYHIFGTYGQ